MLRKFSRPSALIFIFLFLSVIPALSRQIDSSFGNNGLVVTDLPRVSAYILQTGDGVFTSRTLGAAADTPVASAYVR
jgi:hypothetical protein